jgi:hypothetical protein
MTNDPRIQIGTQLALTLASLYIPGAGPAVSGLAAVLTAVRAYNEANARPQDHVPTPEELDAFIASRLARRIPGA